MANDPKLIIIRGPSGAGKSTVAEALFARSTRPTLIVSEDQVRKMFNDHHKPAHQTSKEVTAKAVLIGLMNGYDVIFEGILGTQMALPRLDKLFATHPRENYIFYLDVSYEETLLRHQTRPEKSEFGEQSMKKWWSYASPLSHPSETVIPENSSLEETVAKIMEVSGVNPVVSFRD